jgi:hypothetical protein
MLQLVVPNLISSIQALPETEYSRFTSLMMLHARGRREASEHDSVEALLCSHYGIARQSDWPLAPITYAFDDGRAGSDYWLRADPVHIQVHRDKLILADELDISAEEAQILCAALASHFGDAFTPLPMQPDRWYMRVSDDPHITTTPLSQALGRHIDPLLPQGPGAMNWRKLLNEAQMLLFNHPVNQERESRGVLPVNSLWLWGGGMLPAVPDVQNNTTLYGRDFTARAVAKFSNAVVHALPESWHSGIDDNSLCLIDQLIRCWQNNDMAGWKAAMNKIESGWISPLMKAGRHFRVDDPVEAVCLTWHPIDRWKFWLSSKNINRPVFDLQTAPPGQPPGVDEFGNQY